MPDKRVTRVNLAWGHGGKCCCSGGLRFGPEEERFARVPDARTTIDGRHSAEGRYVRSNA